MISILIPCHNCEAWVEATLESVYAQSCHDWELIVADDGSTDGTLPLLRRHEAADPRMRVLSGPNRGVSATRNDLLDHARGEYVVFLDSDDLLPRRALEVMHAAMESENVDIVEGDVREFRDPAQIRLCMEASEKRRKIAMKMYDGRHAAMLSLYQNGVCSSLWGKLYRRAVFDGIRFPEGEIYEDLSVFYRLAERARSYVRISEVVYLYRLRDASLIHRFTPGRLVVLDVTARIEREMERRGDARMLAAARDRRLAAAFNMLGHLLALQPSVVPPETAEETIGICRGIIRRHSLASAFGRNVRLKNRLGALMALLLPRFLSDHLLRRAYSR